MTNYIKCEVISAFNMDGKKVSFDCFTIMTDNRDYKVQPLEMHRNEKDLFKFPSFVDVLYSVDVFEKDNCVDINFIFNSLIDTQTISLNNLTDLANRILHISAEKGLIKNSNTEVSQRYFTTTKNGLTISHKFKEV